MKATLRTTTKPDGTKSYTAKAQSPVYKFWCHGDRIRDTPEGALEEVTKKLREAEAIEKRRRVTVTDTEVEFDYVSEVVPNE